MDNNNKARQIRAAGTTFKTRSDDNKLIIEGYFAVFNSVYQIDEYMSESIAQGAFTESLKGGDIRALIDHETMFVLGRTSAGTLTLKEDVHGLYGRITINPADQSAVNLYERVKRGDVTQCSIGFDILDETTEQKAGGRIHWTIRKVKLYEVSIVTFPCYEETNVQARSKQAAEIRSKQNGSKKPAERKKQTKEEMRAELRAKLKKAANK